MEEISIENRLELMNVLPSKACEEVFTRADVASKVLELLKEKPGVFSNPNYRFLDIYTKSGVFLLLIYSELMQGLVEAIPDPEIRSQHILDKMIYGVSPSVETALISRKTLYGDWLIQGNIKVIVGYKNDTGKRTFSNISKEFNGMKFDVVIGNPPYNNDMYLDFVTLGDQLATKYTCMITPAKWQAKGGEKNEAFRKNIVPRMSDIVFYPNSGDVFDIREVSGITYYLVSKENTNGFNIKSIDNCKYHPWANCDWTHKDKIITLYGNNIDSIILKILDGKEKYKFKYKGQWKVFLSLIMSNGGGKYSFSTYASDGTLLVLNPPVIYCGDTYKSDNYKIIFSSESKAECESFVSFINTKVIRFLILLGICGNSVTAPETWRFVPAPDAFDHIFTDKELYDKYNLTPEEIAIIESVIKERKQTEDK